MADEYALGREQAFGDALAHLRDALEILDSFDAPAQIGAHIDLALCQLHELIASTKGLALDIGSNERASRH